MPLIPLRAEELLLLSTFSVKAPGTYSPMRRLYAKAHTLTTEASALSTISDLARRRMIYTGKEGKPRLDPNLEPVLWILNSPDQVFSMARMAAPDMAECYFCSSGTLWVQEAVNFDESVELLLYPFTWDDIATWFADDFLKDLSPEGGPQAKTARFLIPELLLLLALQCEYGRRVHKKKGRLEPKDLWVGLDQLGQEAVIEEMIPVASVYMPPERFRAYFGDRALLGKVADGLAKRDLLDSRGGAVRFGTDARHWFDPGRRQAVVTTRSFGPELKAKILYAYPDGFVLLETPPGDALEVCLKWIPGTTTKRELFALLMEGLITPAPRVKNPPRPKPAALAPKSSTPVAVAPPAPPAPITPAPPPPATPADTSPQTIVMRAPDLPPLKFFIESGPGVGTRITLPDNGVIGRLEGSAVRVDDPRVSRRHAEFRRALEGTWTLTDLESANGTFVNNVPLKGVIALKQGDRIRVAETVFVVL